MENSPRVYAVAAEFPSAAALYHAAEKTRDAGYKRWDVHSPFPIHGMDKAMGLGKSWLSAFVFCGGLLGSVTAFALQVYPSIIEYPLIVHGKPTNLMTYPAFFPITFELTILFSAFSCIAALCVFTQLPRWHHPIFSWERFGRVTDDGFFLVVEARDPKFSETKTRQFLHEIGGSHITLVNE